MGITGYLSFRGDAFLQIIEGAPSAVTALYGSIANDRRHSDLLILGYQIVHKRLFTRWAMGYAALTGQPKAILDSFSATDDFTPHEMSFECARGYLLELEGWQSARADTARGPETREAQRL